MTNLDVDWLKLIEYFSDPMLLAQSYDPFHAVQFHPIESKFLVTANPKDGVVLWDLRKPLSYDN